MSVSLQKSLEELADCACQNWEETTIEDLSTFADYSCIPGARDFARCEFDEHRFGVRYTRILLDVTLHIFDIWVTLPGGSVMRSYSVRPFEVVNS